MTNEIYSFTSGTVTTNQNYCLPFMLISASVFAR